MIEIENLYANEPMEVGQMVTVKFGTATIVGIVKEIKGGNFYIEDVRNGDQFKGMFGFNEYTIVPEDLKPYYRLAAPFIHMIGNDGIYRSDSNAVSIEVETDEVVQDGDQVIGAYVEKQDDGSYLVMDTLAIFDRAKYREEGDKPMLRDYRSDNEWTYKTLRGVKTVVNKIMDRVQLNTVQQ